jgi:predicted SAM-dependent methyltransferase
MKMLNIACGNRYDANWVNIDFSAASAGVIQHNILSGLPFENDTFDAIYSGHFLEHLTPEQADFFLKECYEKLKPGGIIRIVVPDLENICREYIRECDSDPYGVKREWLVIEMIDQIARNTSSGVMGKIYKDKTISREYKSYIKDRVGEDLDALRTGAAEKKMTVNKIRIKILYYWLKLVRFMIPVSIRNNVFNSASIGENHKWMYDQYSLHTLLARRGFREISRMTFADSGIPDFRNYLLDENGDGSPYKGSSSLYMEANK